MIELTRTTTERVSYDRDEVIALLMEDEDYFDEEEMARGLGPTPEEGRRLWGERTDAELARFLAERLNEGGDLYALNSVVEDIGDYGTDQEQWAVTHVA